MDTEGIVRTVVASGLMGLFVVFDRSTGHLLARQEPSKARAYPILIGDCFEAFGSDLEPVGVMIDLVDESKAGVVHIIRKRRRVASGCHEHYPKVYFRLVWRDAPLIPTIS